MKRQLTIISNYHLIQIIKLYTYKNYIFTQLNISSYNITPINQSQLNTKSISLIQSSTINMTQPHPNQSISNLPDANDKEFQHFIEMIKNNQLQQVKQFLKQFNSNVLARLELGFRQPALYFAITNSTDQNSLQMLKVLLSHGANPKYKDQNDQTILFYACRDGKYACCKLLIEKGLNIDQQDMYGQTPLFYAASQNRLNLVQLFENRDAINHVDKLANQTALYYAARKGHTEMCKKLIEKGANPAHLDAQNKTPADYAKKSRHNQTAQFLNLQIRRQKQVVMPQSAQLSAQRQQSHQTSQQRKKKDNISTAPSVPRATYKIVFMNQKGQARDLTQQEVRNLVKNNPTLQTYLSNPNSIPIEELEKMEKTQSWEKLASKCLQSVMKQKGAFWFLEPVDPVKFNIMDYFDIIEKPMDLGTVKKKLSHNVYKNIQHFVDDMNLVWGNCYKYNGQHHDISKTAKEIEVYFNEEFKKVGLDQYKQ